MRQIPDIIKSAVILVFIEQALVLSYLRKPHFILAGLFFIEGNYATLLIIVLSFAIIYIGYRIIRQQKKAYRMTRYLSMFFILNSLINLIAMIFISSDMAGFLTRIFGEDVFSGFVFIQILFLLTSLGLFITIKRSRNVLN